MRRKNNQKKWITPEIVKEMNLRDNLHTKACSKKDTEIWNHYKKVRNKVNKMIKKAKAEHYKSLIESHKQNSKRFWVEMSKLMPNKINFDSIPESITADAFNHYFSTIGNNTSNSISDAPETVNSDLLWKGPKSIYSSKLNHICESDVMKCLINLLNT